MGPWQARQQQCKRRRWRSPGWSASHEVVELLTTSATLSPLRAGLELERPHLRGHAPAFGRVPHPPVRGLTEVRHPQHAPWACRCGEHALGRSGASNLQWAAPVQQERVRDIFRALRAPPGGRIDRPVIQELRSLPSGTDAPNTLITLHAIGQLGLQTSVAGWFFQAPQTINPAQLKSAQLMAVAQGMSVETKDNVPSMSTLINSATAFGIGLALAILAMSVGLVRSETAGDLRVLAATGASSWARRTLSAATAGGLALLGALLGTVAGYVGMIGLFRGSTLAGGVSVARERAGRQPARYPGRDACHRRSARVGALRKRTPSHCPARDRVTGLRHLPRGLPVGLVGRSRS